MRIGLLGPVTAGADGVDPAPAPGGPLLRGALARLALDAGRPVGTVALVDALWGDEPPAAVANALQAMISRLRRALGTAVVETVSGGYRLAVPRHEVDALRFTDLVAQSRREERPDRAAALLDEAVALWRGPALAELRHLPFAGPAAARLEEQRAVAVELAAAAALRRGEPETALDALRALLVADPLRESAAVALARALHAAGRRVDALAVLDRTRARLADELGVDPGAELAATRLAVLRTTPVPRRPGSAPLTSFVGRAADVARVVGLLGTGRLVTLTGPGGAGKTRLGTEVAGRLPGEVRVAELAPIGGPEQLAAGVLAAVRTAEIVARAPDEAVTETGLLAALAGRDLVLVLDNCEHLVDAVAGLVHTLLTRNPGLRVLATSRAALGVPGEVLHPVDALPDDEAVRLFAERGAAVRPGFTVTEPLRPVVREICHRLDGQPLAIELAAARLRTLAPEEIRHRLDDRFRLLTTGPRTAVPRHQTLRAVVDWSWELLTEPERTLARRLSVFAGGATEEAARAVGGLDGDTVDTLDLLTALVEKSLVVAVPAEPTRYRMLETVRAYAGERLDAAGERSAAEAAHAAAVLELVEATEPRLRRPGQLRWVARLRGEADDVTAVVRRAVAVGDAATAQRVVAATTWFWLIRGLYTEAVDHLTAVGALEDPTVPAATRALCAAYRAMVVAGAGDLTTAAEHLAAAERLAAPLPRDRHPVLALMRPVATGFADGDPGPLERLAAHPDTDPWTRAFATFCSARIAENDGDRERALVAARAAHALFTALGERWGLGMTLSTLGDLEHVAGAYDAAERAFDEAIALAGELGNTDDLPQFQAERARLWVRRGDLAAGRAELRRIAALPGLHPELVGHVRLYLADAARRAGALDEARAALVHDDPAGFLGVAQRRALHALTAAAVARAAGADRAAAALLAEAVARAAAGRDGPVTATVAEGAAAHALAAGDPATAVALLGVAAAQRGALDVGDPDVRATLDGVRAALGAGAVDAALARGRAGPRADGVTLLQDWSSRPAQGEGCAGAGSAAASSASASASATSRA